MLQEIQFEMAKLEQVIKLNKIKNPSYIWETCVKINV